MNTLIVFILFCCASCVFGGPFVAYTIDGHVCMTDCDPQNKCWYGWGDSKRKTCTESSVPAKKYQTSGQQNSEIKYCIGECTDSGYGYNWCFTTPNDKWDYCSRERNVAANGADCKKACKKYKDEEHFSCPITNNFEHDTYYYCSPPPS